MYAMGWILWKDLAQAEDLFSLPPFQDPPKSPQICSRELVDPQQRWMRCRCLQVEGEITKMRGLQLGNMAVSELSLSSMERSHAAWLKS